MAAVGYARDDAGLSGKGGTCSEGNKGGMGATICGGIEETREKDRKA